jgi:hypothetical protein
MPAVLAGLIMVSLLAVSPALAHINPYPLASATPRLNAPPRFNAPDHEPKDETAPIVERILAFNDFTLMTPAGQPFNLRQYATGKELAIVCFVAGWCKNSNHNGHVIKRLYDKYKDRGLGAVVVMEYSNNRDIQIHINRIGIDYPIVVETDGLGARKKSLHYKYRHAVGDKREWGTPFYVLIDRRDIKPEPAASLLADRVYTVSGEIVESEAEQFIERRIGRADTGTLRIDESQIVVAN